MVGEEAAAADPALLAALADAELAFVVDPIDGTANFAAGLPLFGVMAAAIVRGEIVGRRDPRPGRRRHRGGAARGGGLDRGAGRARGTTCAWRRRLPVARDGGAVCWRYCPSRCAAGSARSLPRLRATAGTIRCAAHEYRMVAGGHAISCSSTG